MVDSLGEINVIDQQATDAGTIEVQDGEFPSTISVIKLSDAALRNKKSE
jgi:hypothetical protein